MYQGSAWLSSKNISVTTDVNSPGLIILTKGLLHLNFVRRQFRISNYPACCWCSQAELPRKTFCRFLGILWRLPDTVNVFWSSTGFFLPVLHKTMLSLVPNLFINCRLLAALMRSSFTHNSCWIMVIPVIARKLFTWRSIANAVLITTASHCHHQLPKVLNSEKPDTGMSWTWQIDPAVCISYSYNQQHNNKVEYLWVKTKKDIDMCLIYLV
jgi:hypothetical protein